VKKSFLRIVFVVIAVCATSPNLATAQDDTTIAVGIDPHHSYSADSFGQINRLNGALSGDIPLASFPQKGSLQLTFSLQLAGANLWQLISTDPNGSGVDQLIYWSPSNAFGPVLTTNYNYTYADPSFIPNSGEYSPQTTLIDPQQGQHLLLSDATNPLNLSRAFDGTGYMANGSNLTLPNGTIIVSNSDSSTTVRDVDGNIINIGSPYASSPGVIQDSAGRIIPGVDGLNGGYEFPASATPSVSGCPVLGYINQPLVGSAAWQIPGPNSGTSSFLVCYTKLYYQISSNVSSNDAQYVIQSVVLPNNTYWAFDYDADDPSYSGLATGNITKITNPLGASESYSYGGTAPCSAPGGDIQQYGVTAKTLNDGNGGSASWSYVYSNTNFPSGPTRTTITDPLNNDEEIDYTIQQQQTCQIYETDDIHYQGSRTNGTVVEKIHTDYSIVPTSPSSPLIEYSVLPADRVTSFGGTTTTTQYQYDQAFQSTQLACYFSCSAGPSTVIPLGFKTGEEVTDYSGTILSNTITHYEWESNPSYLSANILNAPDSITVLDGQGNQASKTTITYDESSYLANQGINGHATTITRSNNSGAAAVSHTAWTATGMVDHNDRSQWKRGSLICVWFAI
jgi:hypothetical protein